MYNSVVPSIFTKLCDHHLYLIPEHFYHAKKGSLYSLAATSYFLQPPATTNLISVSGFVRSGHFISMEKTMLTLQAVF